ncbi:MAG: ABC transporter substrate-binding protein [Burkholderiales bacterium]
MRRRQFIAVAAWVMAVPAWAQEASKVPVVGVLVTHAALTDGVFTALREGLRQYGYEDGKNIKLDIVTAEGRMDRLQGIADEFVRKQVDIIVCPNEPATRAALKATTTIPLVMVGFAADPVALGLVASMGRPKGNVTGLHSLPAGLDAKRLEILKEAVPNLSRVAVLWEAPFGNKLLEEVQSAGKSLGTKIVPIEVRGEHSLASAFTTAKQKSARGVLLVWTPTFWVHRDRIATLALKARLPMIAAYGTEGEDALISYGTDTLKSFRRAGYYIHRLLTGSKPSDLPIEEISTFKMKINMKTAKILGIKFPQSILVRAEDVVE